MKQCIDSVVGRWGRLSGSDNSMVIACGLSCKRQAYGIACCIFCLPSDIRMKDCDFNDLIVLLGPTFPNIEGFDLVP